MDIDVKKTQDVKEINVNLGENKDNVNKTEGFILQNNPEWDTELLSFESRFESGNLRMAIQINEMSMISYLKRHKRI